MYAQKELQFLVVENVYFMSLFFLFLFLIFLSVSLAVVVQESESRCRGWQGP